MFTVGGAFADGNERLVIVTSFRPALKSPISRLAQVYAACENRVMVINGQIQNGVVVPESEISLPDGTRVTITFSMKEQAAGKMSSAEQARYLKALEQLDAVTSENPSDSFRGADHDQALYGDNV